MKIEEQKRFIASRPTAELQSLYWVCTDRGKELIVRELQGRKVSKFFDIARMIAI